MSKVPNLVFVAVTLAVPLAAFAQTGSTGIGGSVENSVPGGITLVPGTVVTPGVGGSAATGTVPLPGTVGSPGVGNLNPGLGARPSPGVPPNSGALYPPTYYPQNVFPGTVQNASPPGATNPNGSSLSPSVANCPAGVTPLNGVC